MQDKISQVAPNLYIGGYISARGAIISANRAKVPLLVINLSGSYLMPLTRTDMAVNADGEQKFDDVTVLNVANIFDTTDITPEYEEFLKSTYSGLINEIERWHNRGHAVVVNCQAGINRSALLIAAYLISRGYSKQKSIDLLNTANKRRNLPVLTNDKFVTLLV